VVHPTNPTDNVNKAIRAVAAIVRPFAKGRPVAVVWRGCGDRGQQPETPNQSGRL
jgi:hypothetical protein